MSIDGALNDAIAARDKRLAQMDEVQTERFAKQQKYLERIAKRNAARSGAENSAPPPDADEGASIPGDTPDVLAGMVDGAWLDAQTFPALQWAVPGIISEGFGLLVAPPKAGKSWLAAGLGLAVASGGTALGSLQVEQRPVLYLALEDGHRRLQERFRKIMFDQPIPKAMNVVVRAESHVALAMIEKFLARQDRPSLVILDTLGKIKPGKASHEDAYQADYRIGGKLKDAVDSSPGSTLLVVHHSRKQESPDFVDAVSGTQGIAGSADFVLVLSRKRHDDHAVLSVTGRDIPEGEYGLKGDAGLWCLDGASLDAAADIVETRRSTSQLGDSILDVLNVVRDTEDFVTPADVAGKLGMDPKTASKYLSRLDDRGDVVKAGRGKYMSKPSKVSKTEDTGSSAPTSDNVIAFDTSDTSDTVPAVTSAVPVGYTDRVQRALDKARAASTEVIS